MWAKPYNPSVRLEYSFGGERLEYSFWAPDQPQNQKNCPNAGKKLMDAAKETVLVFLATCLLKQRDAEKNNIKCVPEPHSNIKHTLQARCNSM